MPGTNIGGRRAANTIRSRHGRDFYVQIGRLGGMQSRHGGFASKKIGKDGLTGAQRAKSAGARGGAKSKRGKATTVRRINVKVV